MDETDEVQVLNNQNTTSTQAKKFTNRVQFQGGGAGHIFTQRIRMYHSSMLTDTNTIECMKQFNAHL